MTRKVVVGAVALAGLLGILVFVLRPPGPPAPTRGDGTVSETHPISPQEVERGVVRTSAPAPDGATVKGGGAQEGGLPSVDSETWRRTRWLAATELKNFEKKLPDAESRAGDSQAAYLDFLELQLLIEMRRDAVTSIQAGDLHDVPDSFGNATDLYNGKPYLMFSTGDTGGALSGMVAVPMIRVAQIKDMRRAIGQVRDAVLREFMTMFNELSDSHRHDLRSKIESFTEDARVPRAVMENRHRLRWSEVGDYVSVR